MNLTPDQLKRIVPTLKTPKLEVICTALNNAMVEAAIVNPVAQAMFVAQIAHESGGFFYNEEIASGAAYENRADLGNTQPGDGVRFKGRGWIQITGRANYAEISKDFKQDFVTNNKLLAAPEWCAKSATWFWNKRKLSLLAAPNTLDAFKTVTKKINGGLNHIIERTALWEKAKIEFGV